jgi:nicotinate-nucleotide pyrophosphorylase (carboxylating)
MTELTNEEIEMLRSYLWADSGGGDATSCVFDDERGSAMIIAEDDCILSGIDEAIFLFEEEGCEVNVEDGVFPGSVCGADTVIMTTVGPISGLLKAERIVLNILSRMTAIASEAERASRFVEDASPGTRVSGTRKTTPGFGLFEKRALIDGGALPHRRDLTSMAMLKDNHIAGLGGGPDAVSAGIEMIREKYGPYLPIEVEVSDVPEGLAAVQSGADIIMLDNMSPDKLRKAADTLRAAADEEGRSLVLEASGGITMENLADYAPHVDVISMGSLTYSAPYKGFKMKM